ncbi:MAG: transporter substrate-binding domain-containing protein [Magnetococcales bacterium]|nr:transporter substrate-binding domain-containing protein [Magnetococcales bacterium]
MNRSPPPNRRRSPRLGWGIVLGVAWLLLCGLASAWAEEPLSLVISDANPILANADHTGILDQLVLETFRRARIPITITPLPSERALTNANAGIDDGDLLRIVGLEKNYPNLIPLGEKWMDMEFSVFTRDPRLTIDGWEALRPHAIGLIRGWKVFERATEGFPHLSLAVNADSLFTLLLKNRVDLILYDRLQGMIAIKRRGLTEVREVGRPLTVEPLFLYLNKQRADLIPRIEATLRGMKQDGSHARLMNDAIAAALRQGP